MDWVNVCVNVRFKWEMVPMLLHNAVFRTDQMEENKPSPSLSMFTFTVTCIMVIWSIICLMLWKYGCLEPKKTQSDTCSHTRFAIWYHLLMKVNFFSPYPRMSSPNLSCSTGSHHLKYLVREWKDTLECIIGLFINMYTDRFTNFCQYFV